MNDIIKSMIERRSCKKYKPDTVPQEVIEKIIEAGLFAASGQGKQSPIILAVSDKETRDKISALNAKYLPVESVDPFYGAPVVLVVLAPADAGTGIYDGSLVIGNMLLAAYSLGLGSCWIHRAKETFNDEEGKEILKKAGIEGDYIGIGNCIIGYPDVPNPPVIPRKENRVYRIY